MNQAQIYAEMLTRECKMPNNQHQQQQSGGPQTALAPVVNNPQVWEPLQKLLQGLNLTDLTGAGNGTIGTGGVPTAGEGQFAGNAPQLEE